MSKDDSEPTNDNAVAGTATERSARASFAPRDAGTDRAAALKIRFGPQKIPASADFTSLIDMADAGYKALGTPAGPGAGLTVAANGQLGIKTGKGLEVQAGNSVGVKLGAGLKADAPGSALEVRVGDGLLIGNAGAVTVNGGKGLEIIDKKICVKVGAGLATNGENYVSVHVGRGLTVGMTNSLGTPLEINAGAGLAFKNTVLQIADGERLPANLIAMWSSAFGAIPAGWSKYADWNFGDTVQGALASTVLQFMLIKKN